MERILRLTPGRVLIQPAWSLRGPSVARVPDVLRYLVV